MIFNMEMKKAIDNIFYVVNFQLHSSSLGSPYPEEEEAYYRQNLHNPLHKSLLFCEKMGGEEKQEPNETSKLSVVSFVLFL